MRQWVSQHAVDRLRERWGVELPPRMWTALAFSITRGEHRFVGSRPGHMKLYQIQLQRADGEILRVPMLVDAFGKIVTVMPRKGAT